MFAKFYLTLLIFSLCESVFAFSTPSSWKDAFYTDDSGYYLKIYTDGFKQRFRVSKEECSKVSSVDIVFEKDSNERVVEKVVGQSRNWPKLFGINYKDYCWFEVKVGGIDLNHPKQNLHAVKIRYEGEDFYLKGFSDSLLIKNRIVSKLKDVDTWIDLGAMGSTPVLGGGVFYKIWEPNAQRVDLFINDNPSMSMMPSSQSYSRNHKVHVLYVPQSSVGDEYYFKFLKNGKYEELTIGRSDGHKSQIKIDPMASQVVFDDRGAKRNGYYNPRAVVVDRPNNYSWENDDYMDRMSDKRWNNWIIYELWPLTFNPPEAGGVFSRSAYEGILDKIDYIADLGVTAVELMPVGMTRFEVSWGYAPDSILTLENNLGTATELKKLVDGLHSRDIRVVLDVVINHVINNLIRDPLAPNVHDTKFYRGGTEWGEKPDYSSIYVRRWIADSLMTLMREFHLDGFRFDFTKHVHQFNPDGYKLLQELNFLIKQNHPRFYSSAEELDDNVWVTRNVEDGGAGFDSQWNDKFKNFFEKKLEGYQPGRQWVDLSSLQGSMLGYSNHIHYGNEMHFGHPRRTVNYLGSHDFIGNTNPILRIVSDFKDYKESDGNQRFTRVRPMEEKFDMESKFRKVHNDFTHGVGRLCYGILFTKPGAVLFYQGEEIAQDLNLQNEWSYTAAVDVFSYGRKIGELPTKNIDIDRFVNSHRMPWEYYMPDSHGPLSFLDDHERDLFVGYNRFFKDMIDFRNKYPGISEGHAYNVNIDPERSIISYQIQDNKDEFFVIANFGGEDLSHWIRFPQAVSGSWWKEIINSSSKQYGGLSNFHNNLISNVSGRMNLIRVASNTIMVFKADGVPSIHDNLYLMSTLNDWVADFNYLLKKSGNTTYSADFEVKSAGEHRFKLATKDWEVELGSNTNDYMSYIPHQSDIYRYLKPGKYRFTFDLASYNYTIEKI